MNYNKPLVSKLDTTTEVAGCQPCIQIAGLSVYGVRQPNAVVGDQKVTVGSPCPQTPLPGTPQVDGVDTGGIDTFVLPGYVGGDVAGHDVSVGL